MIANETNERFKYLNISIIKNINIYCEKPLFCSKTELKKLTSNLKSYKKLLYFGYQLRFNSLIQNFKRKVNINKVRLINYVVGFNLNNWRKEGYRKNSYYINTKNGGGVIYELVHEINLIRYLFGDLEKIKTFKLQHEKHNLENVAVSIFKIKKIIGTISQDMLRNSHSRHIEIIEDNNSFLIDLSHKNKKNNNSEELVSSLNFFIKNIDKKNNKYFDEAIKDFYDCKKMHKVEK